MYCSVSNKKSVVIKQSSFKCAGLSVRTVTDTFLKLTHRNSPRLSLTLYKKGDLCKTYTIVTKREGKMSGFFYGPRQNHKEKTRNQYSAVLTEQTSGSVEDILYGQNKIFSCQTKQTMIS